MAEKEVCYRDDYHNKFDVDTFLSTYFKTAEHWLPSFFLTNYYQFVGQLWKKTLDNSKEYNVLDFGSGPSPWHLVSLISPSLPKINLVLSDYSDVNQQALVRWINNTTKHDWVGYYVSAVVQQEEEIKKLGEEERRKVVGERLNQVRESVKDVWFCDALSSSLFSPSRFFPSPSPPLSSSFSLITTNLCLEAACQTHEQYTNTITNLVNNHLQPSGWLCVCVVLGEHYYQVGEEKFHCLPLSMEDVTNSLKTAGLEIIMSDFVEGKEEGSDLLGAGFFAARKPEWSQVVS
eukprot:CAMPEP_0201519468 /NCGR_PEP_ID=MMETSP0161_2-20130828/10013_1 /ASSEMBLY_ACC=CAM_ASM_000251 /TAXON_ID=180227 /ORGANISM="Neoparamoeba aestuarina, Strain SoJaBio B1-5/56/2" /LENGTH=289 /DNA_ID=CAMNT_0047917507 /DNA_START=60 /DNA_END=926 /DNA_ORIENTATION=-